MKQVIEEKKIIKTSYVTVEPTKKFLSFRHYFTLKKKKKLKKLKKKQIGTSDQKYSFFHSNISIRILHTLLYIYPLALTRRIRLTIKVKFPS